MATDEKKPELTDDEKFAVDALLQRKYSEDDIADFVFTSRTHGKSIQSLVTAFEKAREQVKTYITPPTP